MDGGTDGKKTAGITFLRVYIYIYIYPKLLNGPESNKTYISGVILLLLEIICFLFDSSLHLTSVLCININLRVWTVTNGK